MTGEPPRGRGDPPRGRNIRLLVAYDGTDFSGWQRQDRRDRQRPDPPVLSGELRQGERTVQGLLEAALEKLHGKRVPVTGSGRTDAGVHAAGQVANFYSGLGTIPAGRFVPALNGLLPRDLRVLEARETRPDFHARFDARSRTYRYYLICGRQALPHELRYALPLHYRPRIGRLNDYGRLLLGELDCSLFASPRDPGKSRSRYISRCFFHVRGDTLVFEITANAFLWKMVRSVLGTLLFFEKRDLGPPALRDALAAGDHRLAGPTLPGQGLFLWNVEYYRD